MLVSVSIVEDSASVRDSLIALLEGTPGFRIVDAFKNGESALKKLPAQPPDVVLMDINLPRMNGIECVRQLKTTLPRLRVVMLTVYEDTDMIFQALEAGAIGYLLKQAPPAKILEAIIEVHQGGAPMSCNIARKVVQSFHRAQASPDNTLTKREAEILNHLAQGFTYKEIAQTLFISHETVHSHIRHVYDKLQVKSRSQAVAKFLNVEPGNRDPRG